MSTREWEAPPPDGYTLHVLSDTHIEDPSVAGHYRVESIRRDLVNLPSGITHAIARVHCGDMFHNQDVGNYAAQIPLADTFKSQLTADGLPFIYAVGNHELNYSHTGDEVAQHFGFSGRNYTMTVGPFKFVVYAAADGTESGFGYDGTAGLDWVIPTNTLDWIDTEMGNTSKKVIFVSHCSLNAQFGDSLTGFYLKPEAAIDSIIASHPNVIAHFNGHRHHWYQDDLALHTHTFGSNTVALMQASSCGGSLPTSQSDAIDHPVDKLRPNGSMYATYFPDTDPGSERWEVRWRDHSIGQWGTPSTGAVYKKTLYL